MKVKQFLVLPKLPERIAPLQEMAQNLWYSWNWEIVRLFIRLNPEMWEECSQNPVEMLSRSPQETLERAAQDDGFLASMDRIYEKFQRYMASKKWFEEKGLDPAKAARPHGDRPIRNHGLFSKAERALEMAGWSEAARRDVEIFRLVETDGLTPLLMVLNESRPPGSTPAAPPKTAHAAA